MEIVEIDVLDGKGKIAVAVGDFLQATRLREFASAAEKLFSGDMVAVPLEPTDAMREEGAQRLVRWENGSEWPDSWSPLERVAARNEAERCWRSMVLASMGPNFQGEARPEAPKAL